MRGFIQKAITVNAAEFSNSFRDFLMKSLILCAKLMCRKKLFLGVWFWWNFFFFSQFHFERKVSGKTFVLFGKASRANNECEWIYLLCFRETCTLKALTSKTEKSRLASESFFISNSAEIMSCALEKDEKCFLVANLVEQHKHYLLQALLSWQIPEKVTNHLKAFGKIKKAVSVQIT